MTNDQVLQVHMLLGDLRSAGATQATHGMCVGADAQFHFMAKALGYFMIGCPGVTQGGEEWQRSDKCQCDLVVPAKPFLVRNRDIVRESDVLIATPKQVKEQFRGSGTWATIRYAREAKLPLVIIWPDGVGLVENVFGAVTPESYRKQLLQKEMNVELR
jgi:hypothetical protein